MFSDNMTGDPQTDENLHPKNFTTIEKCFKFEYIKSISYFYHAPQISILGFPNDNVKLTSVLLILDNATIKNCHGNQNGCTNEPPFLFYLTAKLQLRM